MADGRPEKGRTGLSGCTKRRNASGAVRREGPEVTVPSGAAKAATFRLEVRKQSRGDAPAASRNETTGVPRSAGDTCWVDLNTGESGSLLRW